MNNVSDLSHVSQQDTASHSDDPDEPGSVCLSLDQVDLDAEEVAWIRSKLVAVCQEAKLSVRMLEVVVVGDARMARMHGEHLNLPETTDVLTFDLRDSADDRIEGELYVCLDEARRCAADRGHAVRNELLLYAVHGLLHLSGYDDRSAEDHRAMHLREDALLEAVGVGAVYQSKGDRPCK